MGSIGSALAVGGGLPLMAACEQQQVDVLMESLAALPKEINKYRTQNGLSEIPISDALTTVAFVHLMDIINYKPHLNCDYNLHAWSCEGNWKCGCYVSNNSSTYPIMHDKPRELTNYSGNGYEISNSGYTNAQDIVNSWKNSPLHNEVIMNTGPWPKEKYDWKALGAVFGGSYALAWFGTLET